MKFVSFALLFFLCLSEFTSPVFLPTASAKGFFQWGKNKNFSPTKQDLEAILDLVRRVYSHPTSRKILKESFADLLVTGQDQITETQLIVFLYENPPVRAQIEEYLVEIQKAEKAQARLVGDAMKEYEERWKIKLDPFSRNRLAIRTARGKTLENDIREFFQSQRLQKGLDITDEQIEEAILRIKEMKESFTESLSPIFEKYSAAFKLYLNNEKVIRDFQKYADPNAVLEVGGRNAFKVVEALATRDFIDFQGKLVPASDLVKDFYLASAKMAQHEFAANIYESNILEFAKAIAEKVNLDERLYGFDKGAYDANPDVQKFYDIVAKGRVVATLVVSSGLNHQKMIAIDYTHAGKGYAFLCTGNCTYSCVHRLGDLFFLKRAPAESISNSNMGVIIKSDALASILAHEIKKAVHPKLLFSGTDYPVGGIFRFRGKGGEGVMDLGFTPNGANDDIATNMIINEIKKAKARLDPHLGLAQFVMASNGPGKVADEIIDWGLTLYEAGITPQHQMTFDRFAALQGWSSAPRLSGMRLAGSKEEGNLRWEDDPENPLLKLKPEQLAEWRRGIRLASDVYRQGSVKVDGVSYPISAKLHLKLVSIGNPRFLKKLIAVLASYNISEGANTNQEFLAKFFGNLKVSRVVGGLISTHFNEARETIYEDLFDRNESGYFEEYSERDIDGPKAEKTEDQMRTLDLSVADQNLEQAKLKYLKLKEAKMDRPSLSHVLSGSSSNAQSGEKPSLKSNRNKMSQISSKIMGKIGDQCKWLLRR